MIKLSWFLKFESANIRTFDNYTFTLHKNSYLCGKYRNHDWPFHTNTCRRHHRHYLSRSLALRAVFLAERHQRHQHFPRHRVHLADMASGESASDGTVKQHLGCFRQRRFHRTHHHFPARNTTVSVHHRHTGTEKQTHKKIPFVHVKSDGLVLCRKKARKWKAHIAQAYHANLHILYLEHVQSVKKSFAGTCHITFWKDKAPSRQNIMQK